MRHGKAHTVGPHIILVRIFDISIKFDMMQRNRSLASHQGFLQLLIQLLVRGIIAKPLLATADQHLVLGHTRIGY